MGLFKRRVPDVIDLRDHVLARQRQRGSVFEFGFPTRCPSCLGHGYLEHIDPFRRVQYEHCKSCGLQWQSSEEEVLALNG